MKIIFFSELKKNLFAAIKKFKNQGNFLKKLTIFRFGELLNYFILI